MKHVSTSSLFSLLISFALLIAPLPLSAMTEDFMRYVSAHDQEMMANYADETYILLDKKLSNIGELVSRISELDKDHSSLLHGLKKHIKQGYAVAEYNVVLETLYYAENILKPNCTRFNNSKKQEFLLQLEEAINQIINGELTIDASKLQPVVAKKDDLHSKTKGTRAPPYVATIQGILSVTDVVVVDSLTAPTISVTDIVSQGSIQFEDAGGGEYISLQAPTVVPASYTLTLPAATPTSNQVLRASTATPTTLTWVSEGGSVLPTASKTIYVTKYGNDTSGDGSFNTPYASLAKAIQTANSIASAINPICILISAGIYTENNSSGPLAITAAGISIVGESASSVIIMPNTPANNLLLIEDTARVADITFQSSSPLGTGISLTAGNLSVFNSVRVFNFLIGINCSGGASESYGFNACLFVNNGTALNINDTRVELNASTIFGTSVAAGPAVNTAFSVTGANASFIYTGGVVGLCSTGADITDNALVTINSVSFRLNAFDIVQASSSHLALSGCTFELTDSSVDIDIQVDGAGTIAEIIGCEFNGFDTLGNPQATSIVVTDGGYVNVSGGIMHDYTTGIQVGGVSDTFSTVFLASGLIVQNCTTSILQQGTTTLNFNAGTASSSAISINDSTNVTLAFFDLDDGDALTIGSFADENTTLLQAGINSGTHPEIQYRSSLYSTQAIGFENPLSNPSTSFVLSQNNANLTAITTNRADVAGLRLVSDTHSPVGTSIALRGWDINKDGSDATLSFNYQNSDLTGQTVVSPYTLWQLDGFNNLVNLPAPGTQIVFDTDTNLYRSAANVLKTDDNFIVGTLTPDRAVVTAPVTNQLASSSVTGTELGYLSGTTSSVQTQINSKVAKAGDTMTGTLTHPAGTAAAPSIQFTGSTNTGFSAATANTLSFDTAGVERMNIDGSGNVTIDAFGTGVVHSSSAGLLSSSLIVNADITNTTIANAKLATASNVNTPGYIVVRDGSGNFSTNMISLAGTVTNPTDVATKAYVDTAISLGLVVKTPAVVISLTNVALTGLQTIDGVTLVDNDRVLVNGQTDPVENGLWVAHSGAWTRPTDFNTGDTAYQSYVLILEGNNEAGSSWICNTPTAIIGTDPITFVLFSLPDTTEGANVGIGTGLIFRDRTGVTLNFKTLIQGIHMAITNNADDITLATDATNANTPSTIVARDGSGNFSAGTITASLTGAASLNVLKAGDTMTGTLVMPAGSAASPSIKFTGSTNTGFSAATANTLSFDTNGVERLNIDGSGNVTIDGLNSDGVVHTDATGLLTTSLIVNDDIDPAAAIVDTKLDTISTAGKVANSATTAVSAATPSTIALRDGSGNFSAATIFASLTGAASLNVLKAGDTMTGALRLPAGDDTTPTLTFTGSTTSGLSAGNGSGATDPGSLSFIANGAEVMAISSGGTVSIDAFTTPGVIHNDAFGNLSSSLIVNADIDADAEIIDTKLAMISTVGKVANSATTATPANTPSTIVMRDTSGNFSAGTVSFTDAIIENLTIDGCIASACVTALSVVDQSLSGTLSVNDEVINSSLQISPFGTAGVVHNDATGLLSSSLIVDADITPATITGASIANATIANSNLATISSTNVAGNIVVRDGSGNFSAGTITASLNGNATTATTATNFSGSLAGEVTGPQSATVVTNAVSANTASAIVRRTVSGGFSAGAISMTDGIHSGNLILSTESSTSTAGNILKGSSSFIHDFGTNNTFMGINAGNFTTSGTGQNSAFGKSALTVNGTGAYNTAMGYRALTANIIGTSNTAIGNNSLVANTTGIQNTAIGDSSLIATTTGTDNIALGYQAGQTLITGSGNIYIGADADTDDENDTTRIGTTQTGCFVAGISGVGVSGDVVVVTGSGQLGITTSSRRFKHDIQDMGTDSAEIFKLRPVTFAYNNDETDTKQFGLIAEEVEEIFPTLVSRDQDGMISTVRYHLLPALLLNEIQKQHATIEEMKQQYVTVETMNNVINHLKLELQDFMTQMIS